MNVYRLIVRALTRKKLRTLLLIASVAIAFAVFGFLGAFQQAMDRRVGTDNDRFITINRVSFTQTLPYSTFSIVQAMPSIQMATHVNWFGGYSGEPRNQITTYAVDPETYLSLYAGTLDVNSGSREAFVTRRMTALVGEDLASLQGWRVGDHITLSSNIFQQKNGGNSWQLDVVGLIRAGKPGVDSNIVLMHYDYFNETKAFGKDRINYVISRPVPGTDPDAYAKAIDAQFVGAAEVTSTSTEQAFSKAFLAQFGNIAVIIMLVVGASFVVTLFIVGSTMMMAIRERTREFGILLALGYGRVRVFQLVLVESLVVALCGGAVGQLLAFGGIRAFHGTLARIGLGLELTTNLVLVAISLMVALGAVSGLLPSIHVARLHIVQALEGR
jgi:putative ABC transport system permease protein